MISAPARPGGWKFGDRHPPGQFQKGGPGMMEISNPIVINMVQMLGEICERDPEQHVIRALYMITKEVHELITTPHAKS
jgi:hypothetical protein